jgi:glycerate 2-kinase
MDSKKSFLIDLFTTAVTACKPSACMSPYLENIDASKGLCVVGAGKAAAEMAAEVNRFYGDKCFGAVVTRYGYESAGDTGRIKVLSANHPTPDDNSLAAGKELLELVKNNPADIPILFIISGGGSSLMCLPVDDVPFSQKQKLNQFLLRSGASVDEINVVRKQLSLVKGGKLAQAAKSDYVTLIISDVVGDKPSDIASGPTISDGSTKADALAILQKYNWPVISEVEAHLLKSEQAAASTVGDYFIVANAQHAIDSAINVAQQQGWDTQVLGYDIQGEAKEVAKQHAAIALKQKAQGKRVMLFSGGELTVTVADVYGDGGPNQEYLMALAEALNGEAGIYALACDTDGVDGSKDVAGAYINSTTIIRAAEAGENLQAQLAGHNSHQFFKAIDDLIITGPTNTNVNDFRVIVIE